MIFLTIQRTVPISFDELQRSLLLVVSSANSYSDENTDHRGHPCFFFVFFCLCFYSILYEQCYDVWFILCRNVTCVWKQETWTIELNSEVS